MPRHRMGSGRAALLAATLACAALLLTALHPGARHAAGAALASPLHAHTAAAGALGPAHVALSEEMVAGARSPQERVMGKF
jgi:hypothetical protein